MVDLTNLSDADLQALAEGDYSRLSNEGLAMLSGGQAASQPSYDGYQPLETLKNLPGSVAGVVKDTAMGVFNAVTSPIDTIKGIDAVMQGTGASIVENMPDWAKTKRDAPYIQSKEQYRPVSDAFWGQATAPYQSKEAFVNTLEGDPARIMMDASAATGLLGGGARLAGMNKTADALRTTSAAVNPINATANTAKYAGSKLIPEGMPKALYQSAVKFPTTGIDDRPKIIRRALDEKIMPTDSGVSKLAGKISDAQRDILALIDDATASGTTVPKGVVLKGIKRLKDTYRDTPEGAKAIDQIDDISRAFLADDLANKTALTPADLQKWKVKAYDKINYNAQRSVDAPVKENVLKATAKAAKEEIERAVPNADIRGLNARQGELLELQAPLQRATNRIANHNIISLDTAAKASTGGMLGAVMDSFAPGAGTAAGLGIGAMASILGNPKVKAATAIGLNELRKSGNVGMFIRNNPHLSQAEIAAYVAEAVNSANQQDGQSSPQVPLRR